MKSKESEMLVPVLAYCRLEATGVPVVRESASEMFMEPIGSGCARVDPSKWIGQKANISNTAIPNSSRVQEKK